MIKDIFPFICASALLLIAFGGLIRYMIKSHANKNGSITPAASSAKDIKECNLPWKRIKKKYPKALRRYVEWLDSGINTDFIINTCDMPESHIMLDFSRDLYDFFDAHGIQIHINPITYIYQIFINDELVVTGKGDDCRIILEIKAFTIAFKELESRLVHDMTNCQGHDKCHNYEHDKFQN